MNAVLVDTDVVSMIFKQDSRAQLYRPHLTGLLLAVSFMTVAELHRWALIKNWGGARKAELHEYLSNYIVLMCDAELCLSWAEVTEAARRNGRPIGCADAWIAATARLYRIPLVTHNYRDYFGR